VRSTAKYTVQESAAIEELLFKMTKEYLDNGKVDTDDKTYPPYRSDFLNELRSMPAKKKDGTDAKKQKMFPEYLREDKSLLTHAQHLVKKHKSLTGVELRVPKRQKPAPTPIKVTTPSKDDLLKQRGLALMEKYGL
jgi:hypothetical protein